MSAQTTTSSPRAREIPNHRRIVLQNMDQLPGDYSTTPGGTFFSTTPGGTRIVYDRSFLLECRNSPLTKSPPKMAKIPGITEPGDVDVKENSPKIPEEKVKATPAEDGPQFEMDI